MAWETTSNNNGGYSIYRDDECRHSFATFADGIAHHLGMFQEREELQAENQRLRELAQYQDDLLVCYRLGRRPTGKILDSIAKLELALDTRPAGQEG